MAAGRLCLLVMACLGIAAAAAPLEKCEVTVGIDLGTSRSSLAVLHPRTNALDTVQVDEVSGDRVMASVVHLGVGGTFDVGQSAEMQQVRRPASTAYEVKRLMGRPFADPMVTQTAQRALFDIVGRNGHPYVRLATTSGEYAEFPPEFIGAQVLAALKNKGEEYLGCQIVDAVVTVPAYFDEAQRRATKAAGTIAGLNVRALLSEPVAASLAYMLDHLDRPNEDGSKPKAAKDSTMLVYDLGGGTFDVSLLRLAGGNCRTLRTGGNSSLGGSDIDNALVELVVKDLAERASFDIRKRPVKMAQLRLDVRKAKEMMASPTVSEVQVMVPGVEVDSEEYEYALTREAFEAACQPFLDLTFREAERVLERAKISAADVDKVLLVGGSSRIMAVRRGLAAIFGQGKLTSEESPDEAVARGAAVRGAMFDGRLAGLGFEGEVDLVDVVSQPLMTGVHPENECLTSMLIKDGETLPARGLDFFTTTHDFQTAVNVRVLQGFGDKCEDAGVTELGAIKLSGIKYAPKGKVVLAIAYTLDESGLLEVVAKDLETGAQVDASFRVSNAGLSDKKIEMLRAKHASSQQQRRAAQPHPVPAPTHSEL